MDQVSQKSLPIVSAQQVSAQEQENGVTMWVQRNRSGLLDENPLPRMNDAAFVKIVDTEKIIQAHVESSGDNKWRITSFDAVDLETVQGTGGNFEDLADIQVRAIEVVHFLDFFGCGVIPLGQDPEGVAGPDFIVDESGLSVFGRNCLAGLRNFEHGAGHNKIGALYVVYNGERFYGCLVSAGDGGKGFSGSDPVMSDSGKRLEMLIGNGVDVRQGAGIGAGRYF